MILGHVLSTVRCSECIDILDSSVMHHKLLCGPCVRSKVMLLGVQVFEQHSALVCEHVAIFVFTPLDSSVDRLTLGLRAVEVILVINVLKPTVSTTQSLHVAKWLRMPTPRCRFGARTAHLEIPVTRIVLLVIFHTMPADDGRLVHETFHTRKCIEVLSNLVSCY